MLNKLKLEIKAVKWPDKKVVLEDIKVVVISSVAMMVVMAGIDFLAIELLGLIV